MPMADGVSVEGCAPVIPANPRLHEGRRGNPEYSYMRATDRMDPRFRGGDLISARSSEAVQSISHRRALPTRRRGEVDDREMSRISCCGGLCIVVL